MMRPLTLLLDTEDYRAAERRWPDVAGAPILALDPDLHVELDSRGVAHLTPWDLVDSSDLERARRFEQAAQEFWERHARVLYGGINLLGIGPYRHVEWIARLSWCAFLCERAIDKLAPTVVRAISGDFEHGLTQPATNRTYPIAFEVLRFVCERRGLALDTATGQAQAPHLAPVKPADPPRAAAPPAGPYVLLYANHVDLLKQLPLIERLQREGLAAVQMFKSASAEILDQVREVHDALVHEDALAGWVESTTEANQQEDGPRAQVKRWRAGFEKACRGLDGPLAAVFSNGRLSPHFDFLFGAYANKMAWHVETWSRLFELAPPALLIVSDQAPIAHVARARGVACLSLPHGLNIGERRWAAGLTPLVGALSPRHRRQCIAAGLAAEDVALTGSPALSAALASRRVVREPERGRLNVLALTSNLGLLSKLGQIPDTNWRIAIRNLRELALAARREGKWHWTFRPHPRFDHTAVYERVLRELESAGEIRIDHTADARMALESADLVVLANVNSSLAVEAAAMGKPIIILRESWVAVDVEELGLESFAFAESVPDLLARMEALAESEVARRAAGRQSQTALQAFLGGAPPDCAELCARLAKQHFPRQRGARAFERKTGPRRRLQTGVTGFQS